MNKVLFVLFLPFYFFGQTQIGNTIYGSGAAYSAAGNCVSLSDDGTIVAIGEKGYSAPYNIGCVRVFRNVNNTWTHVGSTIVGNDQFDYFGTCVSLSSNGNILAISAPPSTYTEIGYVKIFQNVNDVWTQIGSTIYGEDDDTRFGSSLDISSDGSIIAIGNNFYDQTSTNTGKVKVFQNVNGVWNQMGNTIYSSIQNTSASSLSLAANGTKLAIGEYDFLYYSNKKVRLFENINGNWIQIGNNIPFGGASVSLSEDGNFLAIGDYNYSQGFGKARVYTTTNGIFTQVGTDFNSEHVWDQLGCSVKLSYEGTTLAIGSSWFGQNSSRYGKVSVYKNINENWTLESNIIGSNYDNQCGESVSLSSDGSFLATGCPGSRGFYNQPSSGEVKVFNTVINLNLESFKLEHFTITPIPTSDQITIHLQENIKFKKATIYNTLGQIIKIETSKVIDVSDLSIGTYFIEVITDKGKATKSFIKE
ncbi:T9SS type A sorting domain-containing protein [Flavobacterium sp.]|uniref:T9SS type A sorting domain-containing protein n=1 Tax=Flavobacterium sp. TaxID=239 RepID=UPI002B4B23D3|nr:T9SS type A sorting domain-containing protein [Flavobacterium sp.]HLP63304.1 T9SS type A sorting domain-containing protein [Flavobacterium sp.]